MKDDIERDACNNLMLKQTAFKFSHYSKITCCQMKSHPSTLVSVLRVGSGNERSQLEIRHFEILPMKYAREGVIFYMGSLFSQEILFSFLGLGNFT